MLLRRIEDRLARAESPPSVCLPVEKAGFPKVLCLDQNKWIELARVHYGKANDEQASAALTAIRNAKARGRLVVPIMPSNLDETMEPLDKPRRRRTAAFLVDVSGNFCWQHSTVTDTGEAERAIRMHFLDGREVVPVRPGLLHWGLDMAAVGRVVDFPVPDRRLEAIVNQALKEPEFSVAQLVDALDRNTIASLRETDVRAAEKMARIRDGNAAMPAARRRPYEVFQLLAGGSFATRFHSVLARLRVPPEVFVAVLKDEQRLLRMMADIPTVDVQYSMTTARDRNRDETIQPNDFKDVAFLKQAIAYGNIVVTENRWSHLANAEGVAARHGTRVMASLGNLPQALRDEGCI